MIAKPTFGRSSNRRPRRIPTPFGALALFGTLALLGPGSAVADSAAADSATVAPTAMDSDSPIPLTRIKAEITLDGRIDEPAWRRVEPFAVTQLRPVAGDPPSERTVIRVAYDDTYLYAAAELYDSDPAGIRGNSLLRDESAGDDIFTLVLDSLDDNETAMAFSTNPAGTRIDRAVANNAEPGSGRIFNGSWNTFWDVATRRSDEGWFAEMRIPLTSLRFEDEDGRVRMGLIAWRYIARKDETSTFPAIDPSLGIGHYKPSAARDISLDGIEPTRPVHSTAYVLFGHREQVEIDDAEAHFDELSEDVGEIGLDVKMSLGSGLALDLTVNTDFAQVEADNAQVNLTRFSLFQPEKRQFFQERSSLFEFATGGPGRLFYSRRIGLSDDGAPVPILGGARLVGRMGSWDVGFLGMQTDDYGSEIDGNFQAGESFGVVRLRRPLADGRSFVGGMVTSRFSSQGRNIAWGADSVLRIGERDELVLRLAQTFDEDDVTGERSDAAESLRFLGMMRRDTNDGLGYTAIVSYSGEDYDPGLGFVARTGFARARANLEHNRIGKQEADRFQRYGHRANSDGYWRTSDGSLETGEISIGGNRQTWSGTWMWMDLTAYRENLRDGFELGDGVEVVAGTHDFFEWSGGMETSSGRDIGFEGKWSLGTFFDGERYSLTASPSWTPSAHWRVSGTYQWNQLEFSERDQATDIHLLRLRLRYALDNRLSVDLFSQYSSLAEKVSSNLRLRYNVREGTDLYVVYNETTRTERLLETGLELPARYGRTVLVKYSHTLTF